MGTHCPTAQGLCPPTGKESAYAHPHGYHPVKEIDAGQRQRRGEETPTALRFQASLVVMLGVLGLVPANETWHVTVEPQGRSSLRKAAVKPADHRAIWGRLPELRCRSARHVMPGPSGQAAGLGETRCPHAQARLRGRRRLFPTEGLCAPGRKQAAGGPRPRRNLDVAPARKASAGPAHRTACESARRKQKCPNGSRVLNATVLGDRTRNLSE